MWTNADPIASVSPACLALLANCKHLEQCGDRRLGWCMLADLCPAKVCIAATTQSLHQASPIAAATLPLPRRAVDDVIHAQDLLRRLRR
jgi:hypothetical protein